MTNLSDLVNDDEPLYATAPSPGGGLSALSSPIMQSPSYQPAYTLDPTAVSAPNQSASDDMMGNTNPLTAQELASSPAAPRAISPEEAQLIGSVTGTPGYQPPAVPGPPGDPEERYQASIAGTPSAAKPMSGPTDTTDNPVASNGIHFRNVASTASADNPVISTWHPSTSPGATTGGVNVSGTNPLIKDLDAEKGIITKSLSDADLERAGLEGQEADLAAKKQEAAEEDKAKAERDYAQQQEQMAKIQQQKDVAAAYKVDPNRYMKNQSIFSQGLLALAAGLTGARMGLQGIGGENPILAQLNKDIDRDIGAQEQEAAQLRQKGVEAENLYNMNLKATGNRDQAIALSKAQAFGAQSDLIKLQAARVDNVTQRQNLLLAANAVDQKKDQAQMQAAAAAAAAQQKAAELKREQDKEIAETTKSYVESKEFRNLDEAQQNAVRTVLGRQPGDTAPSNDLILPSDKKQTDTVTAETQREDLKQLQGLQALGAKSLGGFGASVTLPGSKTREEQLNAEAYDQAITDRLEKKGYSARQVEKRVAPYKIADVATPAERNKRIKAFLWADQNGLLPPIKKSEIEAEGAEEEGK